MVTVTLKNGVGFCACRDRMLVLDLERDRYLELRSDLADLIRNWERGIALDGAQTQALLATGLFIQTDQPRWASGNGIPAARNSITAGRSIGNFGVRFILYYMTSLFWLSFFHWGVGHRRLNMLLDISRVTRRRMRRWTAGDANDLNRCLAAFHGASLLFPRALRCLPDALALQRIVTGCGISSRIIFGVQIEPFQAHCWVQHDDVILGQSLESITGFQAILAVP